MFIRAIFLAVAFVLPVSWTMAKAEDAPAAEKAEKPAKKEKKAKAGKKPAKKAGGEEKAPEGDAAKK